MSKPNKEEILAAIREVEDDYNVHITYGKAVNGKVYLVARGKEGVSFTAYSLLDLRYIIEHYRNSGKKSVSGFDDD